MRQKYSPSLSRKRRTSHGPAAYVSSRVTSQLSVCMWMPSPILRISHSTGDKSHQRELGWGSALLTRYLKYDHAPESNVRLDRQRSCACICRSILSGAKRSSASSHLI